MREEIVRDIIERAARAPSGGNLQPWIVHAIAGARLEELKAQLRPRFAKELPRGEGAEYDVYPRELKEPYYGRRAHVGNQLYASLGIPREDRPARYRQFSRNYLFYDAPVGIFVSIDRTMGPPQWSDVGGFIQNIMLLARAHGLHTCPQEAWTNWHKTLIPFLGLAARAHPVLRHRARLRRRGRADQPLALGARSCRCVHAVRGVLSPASEPFGHHAPKPHC